MFGGGGSSARRPVDVFPEFAPPRVEIQTDVHRAVRRGGRGARSPSRWSRRWPGSPGLERMRSKSVPQLSSIVLIFKPGTDLCEARQLVQERLATVTPDAADLGQPRRS